ncbi:hypothetical protein FH609_018975 [Streptomyces sp. 3MP-14]|uniref:TadE-like domain-containing protein n=1 Tax=Streptomyces mimosae TaxID=2586635 RepID=A0A5N6A7R1_9ACTN|nr:MULTISPECIES: TadE family type IV pilus minor pilin [Streptomyces]KAB8163750.1 hypothetical protein FH607_017515 [Streptomyces mimosae]KAB8175193.1 hypothetical protein FH609_018975 [Streptomyces sp. 3MP-14]
MSSCRRSRTRRSDPGAVTVESALVIPALVLFLGALLCGLGAFATQSLCQDAARAGARAAARGEPADEVLRVARDIAPGHARVEIGRDGSLVRVGVSVPSWATGVLGLAVEGWAVAHVEPD